MILLPCCLRMLLLVCGGLACVAIMSTDDESQLDQLKPGGHPTTQLPAASWASPARAWRASNYPAACIFVGEFHQSVEGLQLPSCLHLRGRVQPEPGGPPTTQLPAASWASPTRAWTASNYPAACIFVGDFNQSLEGLQPMPFFTLKVYLLRLQKRARRRVVRRRSRLIRVLLLDMVKRMRADKKKNDDRVRPSQAPWLRKKDDDKKMDDDKPRPSQAPFLRKKKRWAVLGLTHGSRVELRPPPPSFVPLLRLGRECS